MLKYVSHQIDGDTLTLRVKDINADLFVNLIYRVYPKQDIIERHARIENRTPKTVTLESAQSAVWNMPAGTGYRLTHLAGKWAGETQVLQEPLEQGKKVLESRRGNTSHAVESLVRARSRGDRGARTRVVWRRSAGPATGSSSSSRRHTTRRASPAATTISISPGR